MKTDSNIYCVINKKINGDLINQGQRVTREQISSAEKICQKFLPINLSKELCGYSDNLHRPYLVIFHNYFSAMVYLLCTVDTLTGVDESRLHLEK